jgi:hypothetical protein
MYKTRKSHTIPDWFKPHACFTGTETHYEIIDYNIATDKLILRVNGEKTVRWNLRGTLQYINTSLNFRHVHNT